MNVVTVFAKSCATKRTRDRLREHGPEFHVQQASGKPEFCSALGCEAWLLSPTNVEDVWIGWLPAHEVEVCL